MKYARWNRDLRCGWWDGEMGDGIMDGTFGKEDLG